MIVDNVEMVEIAVLQEDHIVSVYAWVIVGRIRLSEQLGGE
jgi:hypothetical protein